jgi:hypothetical protein
MVTVICTKCGKSNLVEFKGTQYNARCGGCSQIMPIGGRETGIKALPWAWISLTFGTLTIVATPIIWMLAQESNVDPLDKHRVVLRKQALSIVTTAKYPKWNNFRIRYVLARFDKIPKLACTRIAYTYMDEKGNERANQFSMKFNRTSADEVLPPVWEPTEIAILDRLRVKDQIEWDGYQAMLKAEKDQRIRADRKKKPKKTKKPPPEPEAPGEVAKPIPIKPYSHECDLIDEGFLKYHWLDWNPLQHGKIVRGERLPVLLKSMRAEYRKKKEFENKIKK